MQDATYDLAFKRNAEKKMFWWTVPDSNRPPPVCKTGALPDELTAHESKIENK